MQVEQNGNAPGSRGWTFWRFLTNIGQVGDLWFFSPSAADDTWKQVWGTVVRNRQRLRQSELANKSSGSSYSIAKDTNPNLLASSYRYNQISVSILTRIFNSWYGKYLGINSHYPLHRLFTPTNSLSSLTMSITPVSGLSPGSSCLSLILLIYICPSSDQTRNPVWTNASACPLP